eukprot:SAG11_NODE_104_length_16539_cov_8.526642_7_plen_79_part_00
MQTEVRVAREQRVPFSAALTRPIWRNRSPQASPHMLGALGCTEQRLAGLERRAAGAKHSAERTGRWRPAVLRAGWAPG